MIWGESLRWEIMFKVVETINFCLKIFSSGSNASQNKLEVGVVKCSKGNLMLSFCMVFRLSGVEETAEA